LHPVFGTPLMATVHEMILLKNSSQQKAQLHDMVRWCMRQGADPRSSAPEATALSVGIPPEPPGPGWTSYQHPDRGVPDRTVIWWHYDGLLGEFWCKDHDRLDIKDYDPLWERTSQLSVRVSAERHSGHSAISLGIAIKRKLLPHAGKYNHFVKNVDDMLAVFAEAAVLQSGSIERGIVDTWTKILEDDSRADVELCVDSKKESVRAHSLILCNASSVLKATLELPMKESKSKVVTVPGVSVAALRHFLSMVYTGYPPDDDAPIRVQLEALDLAHRWQVAAVVDALEVSLADVIGDEFCPSQMAHDQLQLLDELLEAAVLKQLRRLRFACHQLVSKEECYRNALASGAFGQISTRDLREALVIPSEQERPVKRRRFVFVC